MKKEPYQIAFIGGGINSAIGEVHKAASQMDGHFELVAGAFSTHAETNQQTRTIVTTWENFLDGSNVVFSITNYLSALFPMAALTAPMTMVKIPTMIMTISLVSLMENRE